MSGVDLRRVRGEALFVDERTELAGVNERGCLAEDFPMMRVAYAGEQRHEREDA